ncbi:sugar phosphate isomerase/epimerase family protein [Streptomyces sp. NPDC006530]|uniref:sugar phosphate isomerase/epimerase family protein n=1 Tax=Streptomyces sp. NPDC006530 TaxID=3364750 RepID=UPI00368F7142
MRLALSTLGLPGIPLAEVARLVARAGFRGVELRVHPEAHVHPGLDARQRRAVAAEFEASGIEILALAGYARVADPDDDTELGQLLTLAGDLGAGYLRVFPGGKGSRADDDTAVRRLASAAHLAREGNIRILLETHDSHRTGEATARVLDRVGDPDGVGALWDVMHTWLGGESPAESYGHLAPHLGYTQVKDIASAEDTTPLALGTGVLPLAECLALLPPDGWVCWEYEKRWYPEAAPLPGLLCAGQRYLTSMAPRAPAAPREG